MGLDRRCKGFLSLETLLLPGDVYRSRAAFFRHQKTSCTPSAFFWRNGDKRNKDSEFTNLFRELRVFVFVRIALLAARKQSRQDVDVQEGFRRQGFLFYLDPADGHRI